ncbi:hypothetical protein CHUAL_003378 [Chamberlinius hualienensis]
MTRLELANSLRTLIAVNAPLGINLKPNSKSSIIYKTIFCFQLTAAAHLFIRCYNRVDITADDILHKSQSSVILISLAHGILGKVVYGFYRNKMVIMMGKADNILSKFGEKKLPILNKIKKISNILLLGLVPQAALQLIGIAEMLTDPEKYARVKSEATYRSMDEVFCFYLLNYANMVIFVTFATLILIVIFIFNHLIQNLPTNLRLALKLHREACDIVRSTNDALNHINLVWILLQVSLLIFYSRIVVIPGKSVTILWTMFGCFGFIFVYLTIQTMLVASLNAKINASLNVLLEIQLRSQTTNKSTKRAARNMTITELYVTHVQLNRPALSLGKLLIVKPYLIVMISGFVLNYATILFSK